jgi:hypothetical protein
MIDHNNVKGWVGLFLGTFLGIFGLWQIRKGEAYRDMGGRFKRTENPVAFWATVGIILGTSIFIIGIAIRHWH